MAHFRSHFLLLITLHVGQLHSHICSSWQNEIILPIVASYSSSSCMYWLAAKLTWYRSIAESNFFMQHGYTDYVLVTAKLARQMSRCVDENSYTFSQMIGQGMHQNKLFKRQQITDLITYGISRRRMSRDTTGACHAAAPT